MGGSSFSEGGIFVHNSLLFPPVPEVLADEREQEEEVRNGDNKKFFIIFQRKAAHIYPKQIFSRITLQLQLLLFFFFVALLVDRLFRLKSSFIYFLLLSNIGELLP